MKKHGGVYHFYDGELVDPWGSLSQVDLGGIDLSGLESIGGDVLANMDFGSDFSFDPGTLSLDDFSNYDFGGIEDILSQIDPASLGNFVADLGVENLGGGAGDITAKRVNVLSPETYRVPRPLTREEAAVAQLQDIPSGYFDVYGGVESVIPEESPSSGVFTRAADSQAYNETRALEDALTGYRDYSLTPSGVMIDGEYYYMPSSTFNAAKDSQLANEMIERGDKGFEQVGGNALAGYRASGATPSGVIIGGKQFGTPSPGSPKIATPGSHSGTNRLTPTTPGEKIVEKARDAVNKLLGGGGGAGGKQGNLINSLLPLLLMMMAMRDRGGSSGTSSAVIPALSATQRQTPYTQIQQAPGYRPGQGGITYFNPVQYAPRMAAGGIADLARGRLLQGKGDGVSDSIPAMIGSDQPARLARGEYVVDARTVAELGNGSTDAGAERLDEMRKRVHSKRKKAKVGQDSKAYKALPA
jgi:hypothetical protein